MELGLQMEDLTCYEITGGFCVQHEETAETSIPEYCPDMARIVEAVGQLCIREKLPSERAITVTGDVKVTVLYTSEEAAGLRSLTMSVPFSCALDDPRLLRGDTVWLHGRVLMTEARAVTSRKLYLKVLPEVCATVYTKTQRRLCCGTWPEDSLRVKRTERTLNLLESVTEREFSFAADTSPDSEGEPEDLLAYRLCPKVSSVQRIGAKLLVKGELLLSTLYRTADQTLQNCEAALPFSEILDGLELPEEAEYTVEPRLSEGEVRLLRSDSGGGFSVSAKIHLLVSAYVTTRVRYIDDLYSTRFTTDIKEEALSIPQQWPVKTLHQEASTRLEFGQRQPFVYVLHMDCGPVSVSQEDGRQRLHTAWHMKLLYLDESGTPVCTERSEETTLEIGEGKGGARAECMTTHAEISGGVCVLRFPVTFSLRESETTTLPGVESVTLQEREAQRMPSLILRRMRQGETLWDIAKQYQTDEDLIREVNQWENDKVEEMLLIPKLR